MRDVKLYFPLSSKGNNIFDPAKYIIIGINT